MFELYLGSGVCNLHIYITLINHFDIFFVKAVESQWRGARVPHEAPELQVDGPCLKLKSLTQN